MIERVARGLVVALLERIESGQLTLVEGASRRVFGSGSPQATVVVRDPAVWPALARGGKGLAETFMDGLWDSPDVTAVIEVAARNLEGIDRIRRALTPVREPWQRGRALLERNTPLRSREDIAAHYDLGNDLFELMLDETMMYSSAIFERRDMSLEEASRAKLERICDKLVSIEMIEAVGWKDFGTFFNRCASLLTPDGVMALQAITIDDRLYDVEKAQRSFMNSLIFPNGCLPSVEVIARNVARRSDLRMVDLEDITPHYAETLRRWRANVEARTGEIRALGYDERFLRIWSYYLSYCEAGFAIRSLRNMQIVLTHSANDALPAFPSVRPGY